MGEATLNARERKLSRSKANLSKDVPLNFQLAPPSGAFY